MKGNKSHNQASRDQINGAAVAAAHAYQSYVHDVQSQARVHFPDTMNKKIPESPSYRVKKQRIKLLQKQTSDLCSDSSEEDESNRIQHGEESAADVYQMAPSIASN